MKHLFFLLFTACTLTSFAQKVTNKITFPKGKQLDVVTEIKSQLTQEMMGQNMDINVNATVAHAFDVKDASNTAATLEHTVKRIQINFDGMGQTQSFDSDKEADRNSEMGKSAEKSLKSKYTVTVDPTGKVTAVKTEGTSTTNAKADNTDMMGSMMSQLGLGLAVPQVGDATEFSVLPAREVSKGESWTDSLTADKDAKGSVTYTVSDITPTEVVLDYTQNGTMQKTQEAMGMEATIKTTNKTTGNIIVDRKTGLLKKKTATTEAKGTIEAMGQSIPMKNKVTLVTTVKGV
jgi:hypothetical protein